MQQPIQLAAWIIHCPSIQMTAIPRLSSIGKSCCVSANLASGTLKPRRKSSLTPTIRSTISPEAIIETRVASLRPDSEGLNHAKFEIRLQDWGLWSAYVVTDLGTGLVAVQQFDGGGALLTTTRTFFLESDMKQLLI